MTGNNSYTESRMEYETLACIDNDADRDWDIVVGVVESSKQTVKTALQS